MGSIDLNDEQELLLEGSAAKLRLVLLESGVEQACRQSSLRELTSFLAESETALFKGRLQLHKQDDQLEVWLKNSAVGRFSKQEFEEYLLNRFTQ